MTFNLKLKAVNLTWTKNSQGSNDKNDIENVIDILSQGGESENKRNMEKCRAKRWNEI